MENFGFVAVFEEYSDIKQWLADQDPEAFCTYFDAGSDLLGRDQIWVEVSANKPTTELLMSMTWLQLPLPRPFSAPR